MLAREPGASAMADSGSTLQTIMAILVGLLMLGLGATVSLAKFVRNVRELKGPLVGLACQTLAMPFLAYIFSIIFQFPAATTVSVIAIGCTPGETCKRCLRCLQGGVRAPTAGSVRAPRLPSRWRDTAEL